MRGGQVVNYQERRIWHVHAWIDKVIGADRVPEHLHIPDLLADSVDDPGPRASGPSALSPHAGEFLEFDSRSNWGSGEPMRTRVHPLSGATYDVRPDGLLDVTEKGVTGVFDNEGRSVSGELRHCDPQLCGWLAGPQLPPGVPGNPKDFPQPVE